MIVWLASYPRSGNSLLANLLKRHFGILAYSIYKEADYLAPLYRYLDKDGLQAAAKSRKAFFVKTHEMPGDDSPAIYLVRDGRDAVISYAHYMLEHQINIPTPTPENPLLWALEALVESPDQFGGWGNHVFAWTKRPGKTALIRYEDLLQKEKRAAIIQSALADLGIRLVRKVNDASLDEFKEYHNSTPQFYRKGQSGTWGLEMPSQFHLRFWERHGDAMQQLGYPKDYLLLRFEFALAELRRDMAQISRLNADLTAAATTNQSLSHELLASRADVSRLQSEKDTLELDFHRLKTDASEQARLQREEIAAHLKTIADKEKAIAVQFQELVEKEAVIQKFRHSLGFTFEHGPFRSIPLIGKIHRGWTRLARRIGEIGKARSAQLEPVSKQMEFEIVPVGVNCDVAHYLREHSLRQAAYPFDWTVTPIQSVIALLRNDFQDFLREENLVFLPSVQRLLFKEDEIDLEVNNEIVTPALCQKYKILFPHDFSVSGKDDLPSVQDKYAKRIRRLSKILRSNKEVFFVRQDTALNDWQNAQYASALGCAFQNPSENWRSTLDQVLKQKYPDLKFRIMELNEFKALTASKNS